MNNISPCLICLGSRLTTAASYSCLRTFELTFERELFRKSEDYDMAYISRRILFPL